jgi:hypothetical protein
VDYCSIGLQRLTLRVPVGQPFICPECGGPLHSPVSGRPGLRRLLWSVLLLGILAGSVGAGYWIGRREAVVIMRAVPAPPRAVPVLHTKPPPPVPVAAPQPQPPPPVARPVPTPPPLPPLVSERPFPPGLGPVDRAAPPTYLRREVYYGQVTIDCTLDAIETKPTCHVADIRGSDAFSTDALAWLQQRAVQYAPSQRLGQPTLLDHRWRILFEDFSGQKRPQAR